MDNDYVDMNRQFWRSITDFKGTVSENKVNSNLFSFILCIERERFDGAVVDFIAIFWKSVQVQIQTVKPLNTKPELSIIRIPTEASVIHNDKIDLTPNDIFDLFHRGLI